MGFWKRKIKSLEKVVETKYGLNLNWDLKKVHSGHSIGIWMSILKGKEDFWMFIRFWIGLSEELKFWEDTWCGNVSNGGGVWVPLLKRNLND